MNTPHDALLQLLTGGRTHAVLLSGSPAVALAAARTVASSLLAVEAEALVRHPNYLQLGRPVDAKTEEKKAQIPVDAVIDFCARLSLSSFGAGKKIAVIADADAMNAYGQNALLKTLEEPKGDTVIMLLAEYPDRLLPTIRSRVTEVALAGAAPVDAELGARVEAFLQAAKTDRLLQAVALTKGDEAAGAAGLQAFVAELARAVHTTLLAKCATIDCDTLRAHTRALALLAEAPRALHDHANPTLVLEAVALALP